MKAWICVPLIALALAGCAEQARQCPRAAASHVLLGGLFAQFDGLQTELAASEK